MQLPRGRRRQISQSSRPEGLPAYARLSDPILVKRAKDGDKRALEALCERHAPRVEKLAGHLLRDPEDARDAAQEALAKLCVKIRQFRGESQFATWLHRLTINACRDVGNRQRARACEPLLEDRRAATDADPAPEADRAELRHELTSYVVPAPAPLRSPRVPRRTRGVTSRFPPSPLPPLTGREAARERYDSVRPGGDRGDPSASRAVSPHRRGARASARRGSRC